MSGTSYSYNLACLLFFPCWELLGIYRPVKPIYKSQACPLSEKRNANNHLVSEDNTFKELERYIFSSCVLTSILCPGEKMFSFHTLISPRGMKARGHFAAAFPDHGSL
ncbi:hypothetical protein H8958_016768, partial [Nasalis larvatus]